MVAVLLLPVALMLVACLLARLERGVVSQPPVARSPIARPVAPAHEPVAEVVALRSGPGLGDATLRLRRAS